MGPITEAARRSPPVHASARDRLDVLEEAVAAATGTTVELLRAQAAERAAGRRGR